jgi:hypothetical protein
MGQTGMTQYVSGRIGDRLVDQHDRDSIPNRVDPATLGTLQTFAFVLERQRLFTDWADQDVEQVLRNHGNGFYAIELSAVSYQLSVFRFY